VKSRTKGIKSGIIYVGFRVKVINKFTFEEKDEMILPYPIIINIKKVEKDINFFIQFQIEESK